MKILSTSIQYFMGCTSFTAAPKKPFVIVGGYNESGKSSCAEAIACCLGADPLRVSLKKDYQQLVTNGAKAASLKLVTDIGEASIKYPAAALSSSIALEAMRVLAMPAILKPSLFSASKPDQRRTFLFQLMKVANTPESTKARLAGEPYGIREDIIQKVMTWLPGGFSFAAEECAKQTSEARGAWKAVTGETYGAKKAPEWKVAVEPVDAGALEAAERLLSDHEALHHGAVSECGRLKGLLVAAQRRGSMTATLRAKAEGLNDATAALQKAKALHQQWVDYAKDIQADVDRLTPQNVAVGVQASVNEIACTGCGLIGVPQDGKLIPVVTLVSTGPATVNIPEGSIEELATARADLEKALQTVKKAKASVDKAQTAFDECTAAQAQLESIESASEPAPTDEALQAAELAVTEAKNHVEEARAKVTAYQEANRLVQDAARRKQEADGHHADVEAWDAAARALSPSGIPGELLSKAIAPFNEKLKEHSELSGWKLVEIDADMNIAMARVPYHLLSRSARWRADAMIGATIAELSGIRMLFLDDMDLNVGETRRNGWAWLEALVDGKMLDQVWVFIALKQKPEPQALPPTAECFWMDGGVLREAA